MSALYGYDPDEAADIRRDAAAERHEARRAEFVQERAADKARNPDNVCEYLAHAFRGIFSDNRVRRDQARALAQAYIDGDASAWWDAVDAVVKAKATEEADDDWSELHG